MTNSINLKAKADLAKFGDIARGRLQKAAREIFIEIGERLVQRSPVGDPALWQKPYWPKGYVPGHFINNWQVGIDSKPYGIIEGVDASGNGSRERLSHLGRWQLGHTYYFVNNVPYAKALEEGHSTQCPPGGMVALTKLEYPQIVQDVINRIRNGGA